MKYKYNNQWNELYLKTSDTLPIGSEVEYNGSTVPDGWEQVTDDIAKINVDNSFSTSQTINGDLIAQGVNSNNLFEFKTYLSACSAGGTTTNCTYTVLSNGFTLNFTAGADAYIGDISNSTALGFTYAVTPNTTYTVSSANAFKKCYVGYYDSSKSRLGSEKFTVGETSYTFTTPSSCYLITLRFGVQDSSLTSYSYTNIQLEKGTTATSYAPHLDLEEVMLGHNYSLNETKIGTWINGKPIYRKVITYTSTASGWQQFNHNISNIDAIVNFGGYIQYNDNWFRPLPTSETADNPTSYSASIEYATRTLITFIRGSQSTGTMNLYIILEYTKTTD